MIFGTIFLESSPPGVQIRARLDSRLKHAGMTDFGLAIYLTQQAAGNEPSAIQRQTRDSKHQTRIYLN